MNRALVALASCALGCGALVGCATTRAVGTHGALQHRACTDEAPMLRPEPAPTPPRRLLAAVTEAKPRELLVYDLDERRVLWRRPLDADHRPELLGDLVVTTAGGLALGFDATSGAPRLRMPLPKPQLVAAARQGTRVFLVTRAEASGDETTSSSLTALDLEQGRVAWSRELREACSGLQLAQGQVLTLIAHRDLLAFDAVSGEETGCTRLAKPGRSADWLRMTDTGLLYGSRNVHALQGEGTLELPAPAPAAPTLHSADDFEVSASRSAHGRVALLASLRADGAHGPRLAGDTVFFVFYRALVGYAGDGALRFVRVFDADVARAEPSPFGLDVVLESGVLWHVENDGSARSVGTLGARVGSASLPAGAPPVASAEPPTAAEPLERALTELALDPDTRLLPVRELAVDALSAMSEPRATCDLLEVHRARTSPASLRARSAERLRTRSIGLDCLVSALDQHADFLSGTPAPALAAIVPALVAQREARAVPALVEHLFDPATDAADLPLLVDALAALGGTGAREPLAQFLALYRNDSALADQPETLRLLARVLGPESSDGAAEASAAIQPLVPATVASPPAVHDATARKPLAATSLADERAFPKLTAPRHLPRTPPADEGAPFWSLSKQRASANAPAPTSPPWWLDQNPLFLSVEPPPAAAHRAPAPTPTDPSLVPADHAPEKEDAWWTPVQSETPDAGPDAR